MSRRVWAATTVFALGLCGCHLLMSDETGAPYDPTAPLPSAPSSSSSSGTSGNSSSGNVDTGGSSGLPARPLCEHGSLRVDLASALGSRALLRVARHHTTNTPRLVLVSEEEGAPGEKKHAVHWLGGVDHPETSRRLHTKYVTGLVPDQVMLSPVQGSPLAPVTMAQRDDELLHIARCFPPTDGAESELSSCPLARSPATIAPMPGARLIAAATGKPQNSTAALFAQEGQGDRSFVISWLQPDPDDSWHDIYRMNTGADSQILWAGAERAIFSKDQQLWITPKAPRGAQDELATEFSPNPSTIDLNHCVADLVSDGGDVRSLLCAHTPTLGQHDLVQFMGTAEPIHGANAQPLRFNAPSTDGTLLGLSVLHDRSLYYAVRSAPDGSSSADEETRHSLRIHRCTLSQLGDTPSTRSCDDAIELCTVSGEADDIVFEYFVNGSAPAVLPTVGEAPDPKGYVFAVFSTPQGRQVWRLPPLQ